MSRYVSIAVGVAGRVLHNLSRNPALFLPSIIFPVFFFTAFAGGLSAVGKAPNFDFAGGYTAFQFVFVLFQSAAFGGVFTGFTIAADFESGFARRMLLAAPHRTAILLGYVMASVVRSFITITILFVVAIIAGMEVSATVPQFAALLALALLTNLTAVLFGAGVALRARSIQAGPLMQIPVFLILFMAPVYVPLDLLSGWIKSVAHVNPATALLQAGRGLISGAEDQTALAFLVVVGVGLLAAAWGLRGLRSAERAGG